VENGAVLRAFSAEILEASFNAANQTFDEIGAKNENFKKIYEAMKAYRGPEFLWEQVTDGTYDSFMMAMQRQGKL